MTKWSPYQERIFDFIRQGQGHGIVNAVAGSGKTTTLVAAADLIDTSGLFVAFNKHIATELGRKLEGTGMTAKTIHSVGYGMLAGRLGRLRVDGRKYTKIVRDVVNAMNLPPDRKPDTRSHLGKLVDYARLERVEPTDREGLLKLCRKYDLPPNGYLQEVPAVLRQGEAMAERAAEIDFTDMIWLPVLWDLPATTYDWVFVDEAQDLNACQLQIALKSVKPSGRMLFVGDRRQAIYGFAGADTNSYASIQQRTQAKELPLNVCYRCPTSVIDEAQTIVPEIEAAPGAIEGTVEEGKSKELESLVSVGDLVLCRLNAPLISACIRMIRNRIPARVRGRDIGKRLTGILDQIAETPGFSFDQMLSYLNQYRSEQIDYLMQKEASQAAFESLNDRVDCLVACYEGFSASSLTLLKAEIEDLFSDSREGVYFSSVHRAKGLQAEHVYILDYDRMPLIWKGQQEWELEQEHNIRYVAITRAKKSLTYLFSDAA